MKILNNQLFRYTIILLIGCAIGVIFYPSKTISREEVFKLKQKIQTLETEKKIETSNLWTLLDKEQKEYKEYRKETTKKTDSLKEENTQLKQRVSEKKFKIVRPDGTIEEKWFKESETDVVFSTVTKIRSEFNTKVTSIENKWKTIHEKRVKKIKEEYEKRISKIKKSSAEHKKKETIKTNERNFGISLGQLDDNRFFSGVTYDVYGPFNIGIQLQTDREFQEKNVGFGIGMRW